MPEPAAIAFAASAAISLVGAVATVVSRGATRTLLWLLVTALAVAGMLFAQTAAYAAIAVIAVLACAAPILLMLSVPAARSDRASGGRTWPRLAVSAASALGLGAAAAAAVTRIAVPRGSESAFRAGAAALGRALFSGWPLAVLAVALLLLVVLVSAATGGGGRER